MFLGCKYVIIWVTEVKTLFPNLSLLYLYIKPFRKTVRPRNNGCQGTNQFHPLLASSLCRKAVGVRVDIFWSDCMYVQLVSEKFWWESGRGFLDFQGTTFSSLTHTYIQTLNIFEILVVQEREGGKGWNLVERLYVRKASGWQKLMRMGSRLPCFPGDHIFSPTHTKPSKHGKSLFCRKGEGERVEIWWRVWVHVQLAAGKIWWESSPSILAFPGTTFFGLWAPKRIHTPFGREGRGGKGWIFLESVRA